MAFDDKGKCYSVDLSVPLTAMLNSGSGISTMSESVTAKFQAAVPAVQIVRPIPTTSM